jgi:hypothetical protein
LKKKEKKGSESELLDKTHNNLKTQWHSGFRQYQVYYNKTIRANKKTVNEVYLFDSVYLQTPGKTYAFVAQNWPVFS